MKEPIFTPKFILTFLSLLTQAIVMYLLITTISEHATALGATATIAGLISGIYIFGSLCSRICSGRAMETLGWKKITVWSSAIHCLACGGYFLADNITLLLLVRFIHGLSFGAASNAVSTIGRAILPKDRFAEGCGYLMLATTLAVGLGPFIGGQVYSHLGPKGCFIAAMLMGLASLIFVWFVDVHKYDPAFSPTPKTKGLKADSPTGINRYIEVKALPISTVSALCGLGYIGIITFGRLFATSENLMPIFSYFFLIYAFILIFSRPLAGKIQDKYGNKIVCYPSLLAQTIGLMALAIYPSTITVILCAIGCGLGFGTILSANYAVACKSVPTHRFSYAVSTYYMLSDIAFGLGPVFLGFLVSQTESYRLMYGLSALITLFALPVCIYALRRK